MVYYLLRLSLPVSKLLVFGSVRSEDYSVVPVDFHTARLIN